MRLSHYEINEAMTTPFSTVATAVQILNNFTLLWFSHIKTDKSEDRLCTKAKVNRVLLWATGE